jgi:toxin YoeB
MSREVVWTKEAANDLDYWKKNNAALVKRIAVLIESIRQTPFRGIGKPEPLRFSLTRVGHRESIMNIGWFIRLGIM